jgi:uncharacterized protein YkwD
VSEPSTDTSPEDASPPDAGGDASGGEPTTTEPAAPADPAAGAAGAMTEQATPPAPADPAPADPVAAPVATTVPSDPTVHDGQADQTDKGDQGEEADAADADGHRHRHDDADNSAADNSAADNSADDNSAAGSDGTSDPSNCTPAPAPAAAPAPAPAPAPVPAPATTTPTQPVDLPAAGGGAVATSDQEAQFLGLLDAERAKVGLPGLTVDAGLLAAARAQAANIAAAGGLFHQDLQPLLDPWQTVGENVGFGPTVGAINTALVNSPGHYANMVNPNFTHVGIGVVVTADGRVWVSQVFGG